jgi:hypothetical protein
LHAQSDCGTLLRTADPDLVFQNLAASVLRLSEQHVHRSKGDFYLYRDVGLLRRLHNLRGTGPVTGMDRSNRLGDLDRGTRNVVVDAQLPTLRDTTSRVGRSSGCTICRSSSGVMFSIDAAAGVDMTCVACRSPYHAQIVAIPETECPPLNRSATLPRASTNGRDSVTCVARS